MLKKLLALSSLCFSVLLFVDVAKADVQDVPHLNAVSVEIYNKDAVTLNLNGLYFINNKSTNESILVKPQSNLSLNKNSGIISASFGAFNLSSNTQFSINEVSLINSVTNKLIVFTGTVGAKTAANSSNPDVVKYYNGEAAEYMGTYGSDWYIIKSIKGAYAGKNLAIPKNSNVAIMDVPSTNLLKVDNNKQYRGNIHFNINSQVINTLSIENYLKGVVPNEMPASWHPEALKSQAIAARSYAHVKSRRGILTRTVSSQVYNGYTSEDSRSNKAIDDTAGKVVKSGNSVIETFFHSTSGGRTANVGDVWNSNQSSFPYLVTREDKFENSPHSTWVNSFRSRTILNTFGYDNATVLYDIQIGEKGANGEVGAVTLVTSKGTKTIEGNELTIRKLFPIEGFYGMLKSNWFDLAFTKQYQVQTNNGITDQFAVNGQTVQLANITQPLVSDQVSIQTLEGVITKDTDPASITLEGKGWGHRIGMSQYGAKGYAENGWTYDQILKHYFFGTTIGSL
ncbi:SpoIID/LytB domain-containing protein [Metabacillus herbersteinensis]|uniref:SpoIID/LytB domain-containing protein n=1 Tax=Metabacillus herbersteinensis TaxID=283816 RepID=A0ABV6GGC7_9BACI